VREAIKHALIGQNAVGRDRVVDRRPCGAPWATGLCVAAVAGWHSASTIAVVGAPSGKQDQG